LTNTTIVNVTVVLLKKRIYWPLSFAKEVANSSTG